jgi:magnesium-transporting ATPase (P-type)
MTTLAIVDAGADTEAWHSLHLDTVANRIQSDPLVGLSESEAKTRLEVSGPNVIKAIRAEPLWRVFVDLKDGKSRSGSCTPWRALP